MKYRPYPKYKDSGIEWLGEVPEHWDELKLKFVSSVQFSNVDKHTKADEIPVRLCNYVDVYYNDHITSDLDFMVATATADEIRKFKLSLGDVLITKDSESWDDIAIPAVVNDVTNGVICGYHLAQIRPMKDHVEGQYLFRAFVSSGVKEQFMVAATGVTRFGIGMYAIANALFPLPPVAEQQTIASFLDRETVRIDALIEKKQRQIELLQEKRAALISHAVTKGLDPNVKLKDSGIEWLGEVPEHWEVRRLKHVAKMESGHTPDRKVHEYWQDCDIPWVSLNDTSYLKGHDFISDTAVTINQLGLQNSSARLLPAGAVVFTRDATIGLSAITTREMAVSQHIIAWLCYSEILPLYLLHAFYAMTQDLERLTMGSTIKTIGMPDISELVTTLPPVVEQQEIIDYLMTTRRVMGELENKVVESIDKLCEYRTALISAAVTGKIDVREEAA